MAWYPSQPGAENGGWNLIEDDEIPRQVGITSYRLLIHPGWIPGIWKYTLSIKVSVHCPAAIFYFTDETDDTYRLFVLWRKRVIERHVGYNSKRPVIKRVGFKFLAA